MKKASYSLANNCYRQHHYYDYIGLLNPGGRTIFWLLQRAQGSTTKSQLRRNNGTDEQIFGCYTNGRRAHVPGGTKPGALHARPSSYSRLSEEAIALPSARCSEQEGGQRQITPSTVVVSIDPVLLENLIDMDEIDAESVDDCTDESLMEYLESTQERSASVTAEYVEAKVLAKVLFTMSEKDPALHVTKTVADHY
jgi:hypothetical protein